MQKFLSLLLVGAMLAGLWAQGVEALSVANTSLSSVSSGVADFDLLSEGITAKNAGRILSQKITTDGKLDLSNKSFQILPGVTAKLDNSIIASFKASSLTRTSYSLAKNSASFKGKAVFEDSVIEYPDRVRIISKTAYSYQDKTEYDAIFWEMNKKEDISSAQIENFIKTHKAYSKYAAWVPTLDKQTLISNLTDKLYKKCSSEKRFGATCDKNTIATSVSNEVNGYKGTRTITETIDVNKIPLVYELASNKNFIDRLKASNISKEPGEVRLSKALIKQAFDQLQTVNVESLKVKTPTLSAVTPKPKTCSGLTGANLTKCQEELTLLNKNTSGTNTPTTYNAELLNGFTLGESYSYKLWDSYSVLGFTVYDIGVSFYAGYGVGIRIPIDATVTISKNRLEKWVSENYSAEVTATTVDKNKEWFAKALWSNKAFDGKEAVLEAGAYAKWWIILLDKEVFSGQIGGKKDWWTSLTMPSGSETKLIFSGTVKWEEIGLDLIVSGVHISGDLKADGKIRWDISFECRLLSSTGSNTDAQKCRDIERAQLSDQEVPDIALDPITKKINLELKALSDKFFYKNDLGIYQPYGVNIERVKYKPDLNIDLSLRGKVWVNTGDYFGWYWLETPWLKVYSFSLDLPTLTAHQGYKTKTISAYEKNYLYNFNSQTQDIVPGDTSTKYQRFEIRSITPRQIEKTNVLASSLTRDAYAEEYTFNYGYGGKVFFKNPTTIIAQTNESCNDSGGFKKCYQIISASNNSTNWLKTFHRYFGYSRVNPYNPTTNPRPLAKDYEDGKVSELQFATASKAYYYSEATNALWAWSISGNGKVSGQSSSLISQAKKLVGLRSDNAAPRKEVFSNSGEISKYLIPPAFQKFQFAFHPNFQESPSKSENTFAYIDKNDSVQIWRKWKWLDLELWVMQGEPVALQLTKSPLNGSESDLTVITKTSDAYYIYTFEYQDAYHLFVRNSLYLQKSFPVKDYTAFYYDIPNKILYAALREELPNKRFKASIVSLRFNGQDQSVNEKLLYIYQHTRNTFVTAYQDSSGWVTTDMLWSNGVSDNFISSIQMDPSTSTLTFVGNSEMATNDEVPKFYSVQEAVSIMFELKLSSTK